MLKVVVIVGFSRGSVGLIAGTITNQSLVATTKVGIRTALVQTRAVGMGIESWSAMEGTEITGIEN